MTKNLATVIGLIMGVGLIAAVTFWVTGGDLIVTVGVTAACLIGGSYTLTRPGAPTFPPATAPGQSPVQPPKPIADDSGPNGATVPPSPSVLRLGSLLLTEKGFKSIEPAQPAFGFIGRTRNWLSHVWIALVDADDLDVAALDRSAQRFFGLVWDDVSLLGIPAYGTLCFVFADSPSAEIVEHIRNLKRSPDPTKGNWMVYWTVDLATGRVIPHVGSPWRPYPGRGHIERSIRRSPGD